MEYEGHQYWTREELIKALGSEKYNEMIGRDAFGAPQYIVELYDGLVYREDLFTPEGRSCLTLQSPDPD